VNDALSGAYHVAAFAPDGVLVGKSTWSVSALSPKWLRVCGDMLHGCFRSLRLRVPFEGLQHLEVRCTRQGSTALATFYARDALAVSSLLMGGVNPEVDAEVQEMFLNSLVCTSVGQQGADFGELRRITDRPLHALVVWGNPEVDDDDAALVGELSTHFAAALLLGGSGAEHL
jgi:hypothetical protein